MRRGGEVSGWAGIGGGGSEIRMGNSREVELRVYELNYTDWRLQHSSCFRGYSTRCT